MRFQAYLLAIATSLSPFFRAEASDPVSLAEKIDHQFAVVWDKANVRPSDVIDDATFHRRVFLDLIGRIPTATETRDFLNDKKPHKRRRLVDRLLRDRSHARHAAVFWRSVWLPQTDAPEQRNVAEHAEKWIADQLHNSTRYDRIAWTLLTATSHSRDGKTKPPPLVFSQVNRGRPASLASNATRAFLGINLDCAQCHDHPFARWTRDQFWQTAAFFVRPRPGDHQLMIQVSGTKRKVAAVLLDGRGTKWPDDLDKSIGARTLAAWITRPQNPWFARNAVNLVWSQLFGVGLVEPVDDLSSVESGPQAAMLNLLAGEFISSGFDLNYLTSGIVLSKVYQRSTIPSEGSSAKRSVELFACGRVRGLTGRQLYDSLRCAGGLPLLSDDQRFADEVKERQQFALQFQVESPQRANRSLLQALTLMNGELTGRLTDPKRTPTLVGMSAPFLATKDKINGLYLSTVNRFPTEEESTRLTRYVAAGGAENDSARALANVFWALLNSSEFNTNH